MPEQEHHLILIHGAWAGRWVWDAVLPIFEQQYGYVAHAVDLPGNGSSCSKPTPSQEVNLQVYCNFIEGLIDSIDSETVTVITHSGAGVIGLQVAENMAKRSTKKIAALVIVAGMLLPSGMTYPEVRVQTGLDDPLDLQFTADGSASTVPVETAARCFFQDLPAPLDAARRLTAQPTSGLAIAPIYGDSGGAVMTPKLYVEATLDASVLLPIQRHMQQLWKQTNNGASLTVVSMATGHAPHVSKPEKFCQIVDSFLRGL